QPALLLYWKPFASSSLITCHSLLHDRPWGTFYIYFIIRNCVHNIIFLFNSESSLILKRVLSALCTYHISVRSLDRMSLHNLCVRDDQLEPLCRTTVKREREREKERERERERERASERAGERLIVFALLCVAQRIVFVGGKHMFFRS